MRKKQLPKGWQVVFGILLILILLTACSTSTGPGPAPTKPSPTATCTPIIGTVIPGGKWISPVVGQALGDIVHFAAHAYPTNCGDPQIAYVNFTVNQPHWMVACRANAPPRGDIFKCDADFAQIGVPHGKLLVSFDVYDVKGNKNLSPNGEHQFCYQHC